MLTYPSSIVTKFMQPPSLVARPCLRGRCRCLPSLAVEPFHPRRPWPMGAPRGERQPRRRQTESRSCDLEIFLRFKFRFRCQPFVVFVFSLYAIGSQNGFFCFVKCYMKGWLQIIFPISLTSLLLCQSMPTYYAKA